MLGKCALTGFTPWVPPHIHQAAEYLGDGNVFADLRELQWPVEVQHTHGENDPTRVLNAYLGDWWRHPLTPDIESWVGRVEEHLALYSTQVIFFGSLMLKPTAENIKARLPGRYPQIYATSRRKCKNVCISQPEGTLPDDGTLHPL